MLAAAFMGGAWEEEPMWRRGRAVYGHAPRWLRPVVREVLAGYVRPPVDRPRELAAFIAVALARREGNAPPPQPVQIPVFSPRMGRMPWPVPRIETTGELAERLELDAGQLAWLADVRGLERVVTADRLRNYRYRLLPRAGGPPRVIERPRARLKEIQRFILREILVWIPPHDAAHGFVPNRSAKTHAALHAGRPAVLRVDVEDFFAAVTAARVYAIFRTAGYPESVAHALTGLCTNVVPRGAGDRRIPAAAAARDAASPAGRADLAGARESRRAPAGPAAERARRARIRAMPTISSSPGRTGSAACCRRSPRSRVTRGCG